MADIAAPAPAVSSSEGSTPAQSTGTTAPSGDGQVEGQVSQSTNVQVGEPPRERWNDILENTRKKTRAEADAEWSQRFEPYQALERDPWTAIQNWLSQAEKHSVYGPMVSKHYESRQQARQPAAEPQPDVPIVDERGNVTGKTYSADRLREWHQWNDVQTQAKLDARFGPIEQREQRRAEAERAADIDRRANEYASATLADLRQQPHYTEHEAEIRQALLDHEEWGSNVYRAYMHVMTTKILPNLSAAEAQSTLDSITKQGEANTVTPGTTAVGKPKFKGFGEAARYYAEHPEEAAAMAGRRR